MSTPLVWQLAEVNVARPRAPLDSQVMAGFVRALDDVTWLADNSPGFVWRLPPQDGPVTVGDLAGDRVIVTLSVWDHFEALQGYVYRSAHGLFMQKRSRWFEPIGGHSTAMWWVPEGSQPSVAESLGRLEALRAQGPTPRAFSLRMRFDPDDAVGGPRQPEAPPAPGGRR